MTVVAVMIAGALGAVLRFVVDGSLQRFRERFPWGTLLINVTGSFIIGVLAGAVIFHGAPDELKAVAGTGFCGGYTTFSTASVETVRLAQQRRPVAALTYAGTSLGGSVLGCVLGLLLAHAM